jgi:hypothetical protein
MANNIESYGQTLANRLIDTGLALSSQLIGCTLDQINEVMEVQQVERLPIVYQQFLSWMGQFAGDIYFSGTDVFYPAILKFKVFALKVIRQNNLSINLSKRDFVFLSHQGYQFMYFDVNHDDPDVIGFSEAEVELKNFGSLSSWLLDCIDEDLQNLNRLRNI